MKQKKENSVALLLHWAGEQKFWLFLAILLSMCSGLCIIVPYIGIYRLMATMLMPVGMENINQKRNQIEQKEKKNFERS